MIASLSGRLLEKSPDRLVVDVHGIGYEVFVSLQAFTRLPPSGEPVELKIHTHLREDAIQLFGFLDEGERESFRHLLGVAGIGPKLALGVLSGIPAPEFWRAVRDGDLARLVSIPGVGRKTAERLVVELKDKSLSTTGLRSVPIGQNGSPMGEDAVGALMGLGYKRAEAERAVELAMKTRSNTIEEILREALRSLASGS